MLVGRNKFPRVYCYLLNGYMLPTNRKIGPLIMEYHKRIGTLTYENNILLCTFVSQKNCIQCKYYCCRRSLVVFTGLPVV